MFQKYASAIFSLLILILGPLSTTLKGVITPDAILQLVVLTLGGVVMFLVPLVKGPWAGALKTGVQLLAAGITLAIPFVVSGSISPDEVVTVITAFIMAAATQLGIVIRKDDAVPAA